MSQSTVQAMTHATDGSAAKKTRKRKSNEASTDDLLKRGINLSGIRQIAKKNAIERMNADVPDAVRVIAETYLREVTRRQFELTRQLDCHFVRPDIAKLAIESTRRVN